MASVRLNGLYLPLLVGKELRYSIMAGHLRLGFDSKLWEGRRAIFCEKWIISHVRVQTIKTNEWGLSAKLDVIPIRGLYGREESATSIGSIWDYLFVDEHIWLEKGYCGWRVFFESQVIDEVLSIASSFPADSKFEPYDMYYQALVQPLKKAGIRVCDDPKEWRIPPREPDEQTANDFARSWVAIEQFFKQGLPPSASKDHLVNFVTQLRRDGYDGKLRAGQSLFAFTLSRSCRYGLRPDQPWIAFLFHDNVMDMTIGTYPKQWTCTLEPLVSPAVITALGRLIKHPVD